MAVSGDRRRRAVTTIAALIAVLGAALAITPGAAPTATASSAQPPVVIPAEDDLLDTLRTEHPRLFLTSDTVDDLRARIDADATLALLYDPVRQHAEDLLAVPPQSYDHDLSADFLETSQEGLRRIQTLGLVWLVDQDPAVAERGWAELEAMAVAPDWHPEHFLDTAELTHATGLGLDWFHATLTADQRDQLATAIEAKGLTPARESYDGTAPIWIAWWTAIDHNWNQVVNGGVSVGALAVADRSPALAGEVLHEALTRLPAALAHYAPDGGWPEGQSYWLYATEYTVYATSALVSALGDDFGLSDVEGLDRAGDVPIHLRGPTGQRLNTADDGEPRSELSSPAMFWLADRFDRPELRAYQLDHARPEAMDVVWYRPESRSPTTPRLDHAFEGTDVASLRGSWTDPGTTWVAVKGGFPQFNHAQLDVGSFVFEAEGERWAIDLGRDDYDLPGYFLSWLKGERWTYYRNRAEGHNTLVLAPGPTGTTGDQWPKAHADLIAFGSTSDDAFALVDLSSAYPDLAAGPEHTVQRGVRLVERARVLVQDELALAAPSEVWWFMHTRAGIDLADGGRTALLTQGGQTIRLRVLAPTDAVFTVTDAAPLPGSPDPAGQATNTGVSRVAIHLTDVTTETIAVSVEPDEAVAPVPVAVEPLATWPTCGPAPAPGPFPDVGGTHPFCADIEWLADGDLTDGYPDGTFRPATDITRGTMAAFLHRHAGAPPFSPPTEPTFTDVPPSHPFFTEIEWAAAEGIAGGYLDGSYRPGSTITRASMAAFFHRRAGEPVHDVPEPPTFVDVPASHRFATQIEWLAATGLTGGYVDGTYRPADPVTRGSFAAFLNRFDQW